MLSIPDGFEICINLISLIYLIHTNILSYQNYSVKFVLCYVDLCLIEKLHSHWVPNAKKKGNKQHKPTLQNDTTHT